MAELDGVAAIHDRIEVLAGSIGAPADLLPERRQRGRDGSLWIYANETPSTYGAIYFEGGASSLVIQGADAEAVVRQVLDSITFSLAVREARAGNKPDGDARIPIFAIQQRLMDQLDPDWGAALRLHHARLLATQPPVLVK